MADIFPRWTRLLAPAIAGAALSGLGAATFGVWYWFSPQHTDVGYQPDQPVPFSHALHAGQIGLDCRYCHATVEVAAMAAVPSTEICMNCHRHVRADSPKLELVRSSFASSEPVPWVRVHMLPDYAYFDHSVHLAAGVGCASCHGRIDKMEVVTQTKPLSMSWCLECHRNPGPHLRPASEVTNMSYDPARAGYDPAADTKRQRQLRPPQHCSGCHR